MQIHILIICIILTILKTCRLSSERFLQVKAFVFCHLWQSFSDESRNVFEIWRTSPLAPTNFFCLSWEPSQTYQCQWNIVVYAPRTMTADQLSPIDGERTMSVQHRRPAVACRANSWLTVDQISGVAEVSPRSRAAPCLRCRGVVCVCFASQLLSLCSVAWRFLI